MPKANKHGLRKAAEERTARHAQRTALPPRAGQVQDAKDVITAGLVLAQRTDEMGPAMRKLMAGAEASGETPSAKKIAKAYVKDAARETEPAVQPATSTPTARTSAKQPSAKADDFIAAAAGSGWDADHSVTGTSVRTDVVTVQRGEEAITIEWQNGVFMPTCLYRRPDGSTAKVRNASHAKQIMAAPAPTAQQLGARRAVRERMNGKGEARIPVRTLPFDMELMTDAELAEALRGCKLVWVNSISGTEESDIIPPPSNCYVAEGFSGRQIHFNGPTGARSVRISSIIHVGGSRLAQAYRRTKKASA
jgi:hypothetical protein